MPGRPLFAAPGRPPTEAEVIFDFGATDVPPTGARCYVTDQAATRYLRLGARARVPVSEMGAAIIAAESGRLHWRERLLLRLG